MEKKKKKEKLKPPDYFQWVSDFINNLVSSKDKQIADCLRKRHDSMRDVYSEIDTKMESLTAPPSIVPERHAYNVLWAIIDAGKS